MIVDLERNDLSRVCEPGSVHWPELMVAAPLAGVEHLVSTVEGEVRPEVGLAALLDATFPGGSVTGAPKIAAVDLIASLEPVGRGASMGALGRVYGNGDLELALTIRTFAIAEEQIHLWVGGGVVWDSDPESEVEESLTKADAASGGDRRAARSPASGAGASAEAFRRRLGRHLDGWRVSGRLTRRRVDGRRVDGRRAAVSEPAGSRSLRPLSAAVSGRGVVEPGDAVVACDDEGFGRGRAAFETLRVYDGRPFRLAQHVERLRMSADATWPARAFGHRRPGVGGARTRSRRRA